MSAAKDAVRVAALVSAIDSLAEGKPAALGDVACSVFGWDVDRVFSAIDHAVAQGLIARNAEGQVSKAPTQIATTTRARLLEEADMLTMCVCGHDYGTHHGRKACARCSCKTFRPKGAP